MLGADEERPSHPSLGQAQAAEGTVSTVGMRPCGDGGVWTRTGRARRPRVLGADEERPSHPSRDKLRMQSTWCPHGDEALRGWGWSGHGQLPPPSHCPPCWALCRS